jgi:monofunctional biosynthetic peptidoglycan transglycosylase
LLIAARWIRHHLALTVLLFMLGWVVFELATIPFFGIWHLRTANPRDTALMRQRIEEAKEAGEMLRIHREWIPISRIPHYAIDAVVVEEDGTFFTHGGVDWFEIQESLRKDLSEGRAARGASTITQQLAKNLFLSTSKDPIRKLKELLIAVLMEHALTKQRILELYLNEIEWGKGVFGIEAASAIYFGKSAESLSLDEAARLAAVIPSPLRHRPDSETRYVMRRKAIVLRRMEARGMIESGAGEEIGEYGQIPGGEIPQMLPHTLPDTTWDAGEDTTEIDNEGTNGL